MTDEQVVQQIGFEPGVGLDVGTAFLQVARQQTDGMVQFISERDAFYPITPKTDQAGKMFERTLKKQGTFTLKSGNTFFVVGEKAVEMAMIRGGSTERPLQRGVLTAGNDDSMGMLAVLIEALIGKATVPNEPCVYSYPADPIDETFDVVYHHNRIAEILSKLGYKPEPMLEAEALAYSEFDPDIMTGIAISCGAGMHNLAVFHSGESLLSFSIAQGGDYIDKKVAAQLGISETEAQAEKEADIDLTNPQGRVQVLISDYYTTLIQYIADTLEAKFQKKAEGVPKFNEPVLVVISGGTSLPKGYIDKMEKALRSKTFPFKIGEIKHAGNPLTAVANGCLIYAQMLSED
jgi:hypothetical protein